MLKVGESYQSKVIGLDYKGDGIINLLDSYIYVPGALEGELVDFKLTKFRKGIGFGKLVKIRQKSDSRVSDYNHLGSLNLAHLEFSKQLEWQSRVTKETFEKVFKKEINIKPIITDNVTTNYRNKVTFHLLDSRKIKLGLYETNSKKLVEVNDFLLANKSANEVLKTINSSNIDVDYKKLRHIMIKNNSSNELLVTLVSHNRSFFGKDELIELISQNPRVKGITLNIKLSEEVILGNKSTVLYGVGELKEGNLLMTDQSFMQVNFGVMNLTNATIKHYINETKIIDAYSGIGSIVYSILDSTMKAVLIESSLANIKLATKIKEANNLNNVEIVHDLAENAIGNFDAKNLIVDPPRVGLKESFVNVIKRQLPSRVIYLSCNLQTLIRDVRLLEDDYDFEAIYPVKMFPQTNSFETLVILNKK